MLIFAVHIVLLTYSTGLCLPAIPLLDTAAGWPDSHCRRWGSHAS
jgi:hypothetical protein